MALNCFLIPCPPSVIICAYCQKFTHPHKTLVFMANLKTQDDKAEGQHNDIPRVRSWPAQCDELRNLQQNTSPDSCRYTLRKTTILSSEAPSLKRPADHFHGLNKDSESLYGSDIRLKWARYVERGWDLDPNRDASSQDTQTSTPFPNRINTGTDPIQNQPFAEHQGDIGSPQQRNSPNYGEHRHGMPSSEASDSEGDNLRDVGQQEGEYYVPSRVFIDKQQS